MEDTSFSRNELYWGKDFQAYLSDRHVIAFGLGGVGSYAVEMLARSGVGNFTIIDFDKTSKSNINRQLIALENTIGQNKTDLVEERILQINPHAKIHKISQFYDFNMNCIFDTNSDFVIDAIDTFKSKIELLEYCMLHKLNIITSMGAANRINPEKLYITDISAVEKINCNFANRVIIKLKKDGYNSGLTMVLSREKPIKPQKLANTDNIKNFKGEYIEVTKLTPATTPFVASCAGILMASFVIRKLLKDFNNNVSDK